MSTKLKIAASVLLLAGLIAVAWPKSPAPQAADLALAPSAPHAAPIEKGTPLAPEPLRSERANALPSGSSAPAVVLQPRAAAVPINGLLLDVGARPLPGLRVTFHAGHREVSASEFRLHEETRDPNLPGAQSAADGRFQIDAPDREGELVVDEPRWTTVLSSLCRAGNAKAEHVVVAAPHLEHAGHVVNPAGKLLAGARIELHPPKSLRLSFPQILDDSAERAWIEESGPDGSFRFADAVGVEGATLSVALTGYRRLVEAAPLASNPALELVLQPIDAQPGMVYGEVLDPRGEPVRGARITLGHANLTLSDEHGQVHLQLNISTVFWTFAITDSGGGFELQGLLDRNYRLAVLDPQSMLRFESGSIAAGTHDALVRVPGSAFLEGVHGRVLSAGGRPVAGVTITPGVDGLSVQIDAHSRSSFGFPGAPIATDAEGRFRFARLPREQAFLTLSSEDIVPLEWGNPRGGGIGKAVGDPKNEVVIRVELSFHLQVEFEPGSADELRALDTQGQTLMVHVFEGTSSMSMDAMPLEGGHSKILVV